MEFYCKTIGKSFGNVKQFVAHTEKVDRGALKEEDLVFEEAAKQLVEEEEKAVVPENKVTKEVVGGPLTLVLVTDEAGRESVRLRVRKTVICGVMEIRRRLLEIPSEEGSDMRRLINYIKTYLPAVPRKDYTLADAFTVIERKMNVAPAFTVNLNAKPALVSQPPRAQPYTTGSPAERETLFKITSVQMNWPVIPATTGSDTYPRLAPDEICKYTIEGTAAIPVVRSPGGVQMPLEQFVASTAHIGGKKVPLVLTNARSLLSATWM
eukprot:TRINITY_DN23799_c0_g1_i1.p1 TRINITY_DN23799_c0_g1~~TRINITY_DN23799_c0_g1_i1.p1  ORF type:complete len:309 (+),score=81.62 TRINITY_DN23799_c0_g1_i1:132-929(+)